MTISIFLDAYIFGAVFGAIAIFLSSYTMTLARMMGIKGNVKIILLVIEAIGLATGAYGFILGLSKMF